MSYDASLTQQILRRVKSKQVPGAPCARFDTSTSIGGHDPETVLRRVVCLREDGLLRAIDVKTGANDQPVEVSVRGLTFEGEQLLRTS